MAAVTTAGADRAAARPWRGLKLDGRSILFTVVLGVVAFIVVYPLALLLISSFQVGEFGQATTWGLDNWRAAFSEPRMRQALINTLTLTFTRQVIAFVVGVGLAWLLARTNIPGRNWLEFGFWVATFLPVLPLLMGWILLLDGQTGLVNQWLAKAPFVHIPRFDIFSWWGIVFVHLMTGTLAIKVMLLTPAFRNMDASLEEASRTCGSSTLGTLFRVVVPVMLPTILVVMLLGTIRSMQAFEIELVLGSPANIDVYSTLIYRQANLQPPRYGTAIALAMIVLVMLLPFVVLQQWFSRRRSHATVSGKYTNRLQDLGRWRWPIFGGILSLLMVMTVVPVAFLVMGSFMKIFGFFDLAQPWTLRHWETNLTHPNLIKALKNSLVLGIGAAVVGMVVFSLIAYISARTRYIGRGALDFLTWLPTTIPGIVISLGFLWFFLQTPLFRPLYGSIVILIIAVAISTMTVGVQLVKTSMVQLGNELEEASWVSGASWIYTFRRVVLPLIAPAVAVVGLQVFAAGISAVGLVALLGSSSNQPLSLLQLAFLTSSKFGAGAVTGLIILALTVLAALAARIIGLRVGLARSTSGE